MKKIQTVGIIREGNKILLGLKKRGFGAGRWNGFGGKVEKDETPIETMKRELFEEVKIRTVDLVEYGTIAFRFENHEDVIECHFFLIEEYEGNPIESEEMRPEWFDIAKIPYDSMWPDDRFWLPLMLKGKKFDGKILFNSQGNILKNGIKAV